MSNLSLLPNYVKSYLNKFSFNFWKLEKVDNRLYNNIIVIPSLAEYDNILSCLNSLEQNDNQLLNETLLIIVINNSHTDNLDIINNNKKTYQLLHDYSGKLNINFIDAFSDTKSIPKKLFGVGFARKIGLDIALTKFDYNSIKKKILIWLDADCQVSQNYLSVISDKFNNQNYSSAVIEYEHKIDDSSLESKAIILYETYLRYLKLAISYANCYYDYHSIGSTIVCDVHSYIKAGGMNSKQAGEDFYFLEKLAKQNKIKTINETIVYPSARISWRVPFGTGNAVMNFINNDKKHFFVYNPEIFHILKQWFYYFNCQIEIDTNNILHQASKINHYLYDFLLQQKFQIKWNKILQNSNSPIELKKQKIFWFDAFRTLKLIHYLRDNSFPNINIYDAFKILLNNFNHSFEIDWNYIKEDYQLQKYFLFKLRQYCKDYL